MAKTELETFLETLRGFSAAMDALDQVAGRTDDLKRAAGRCWDTLLAAQERGIRDWNDEEDAPQVRRCRNDWDAKCEKFTVETYDAPLCEACRNAQDKEEERNQEDRTNACIFG